MDSSNIQQNLLFINGFEMVVNGADNMAYHLIRLNFPGSNIGMADIANPSIFYLTEPGDKLAYDDLLVTMNVDEDLRNWKEIMSWMRRSAQDKDDYRDIRISLLTNKKNYGTTFTFTRAYPYSMSPINMDLANNPDLPPQIDVIFKFVDITY